MLFERFEHRPGHVIGAIGGAALAAAFIGLEIDIFESLERNARGHIDGLGDRAVDMLLRRRLHRQMIVRRKRLGVDEIIGQRRVFAETRAEGAPGIIAHLFLAARAIGLQHACAYN